MAQWECTVCGWIYDEYVEGIPFEDQAEDYTYPSCGVPKSFF
jgi:rubredoxin